MPRPDWNQRYADKDTPWDSGEPDPHLIRFLEDEGVAPCRVLDVGCGTGTNAVWLARRGFEVTALDLAPLAIEAAKAKAAAADTKVDFHALNFLEQAPPGGPFQLVVDRAVWHVFDAADERARFAENVAAQLEVGGLYFTISGSTEGPARDHGPPRRTVRDLADAIEPHLELVWLRDAEFAADLPSTARSWLVLARKRALPAQPSSKRKD